jgi:hypothetical protein
VEKVERVERVESRRRRGRTQRVERVDRRLGSRVEGQKYGEGMRWELVGESARLHMMICLKENHIFLLKLQVFLWPIGLIFLAVPFAILTNFNPARFTLSIYFG